MQKNGPAPDTYTPETDLTPREQVARYEAMGLSYKQACLLVKIDRLKQGGAGVMLLVNPKEMSWAYWRVVPDGLT